MNSTELKDEIILYGGDEVAEIGEDMDAFMVWLGAALVNRHEDVCVFQNMWESDSFSFSTKGFEAPVPTDWDHVSSMILYTDSNRQNEYDSWSAAFGVHRFWTEQSASQTFYRRYRKQPNEYTSTATDVTETSNPRLRKIIIEEIIAVYLSAQNDLEASNAEQSALHKANRNG